MLLRRVRRLAKGGRDALSVHTDDTSRSCSALEDGDGKIRFGLFAGEARGELAALAPGEASAVAARGKGFDRAGAVFSHAARMDRR